MASKIPKKTDAEIVSAYMNQLVHPLKKEIETVRKIIIDSNKKLSERIKWNAPSYYYKNDLVTFNLRQTKFVQLVFHDIAIVEIKSDLLTGNYVDRRLAAYKNMDEIKAGEKELSRIMNELVEAME